MASVSPAESSASQIRSSYHSIVRRTDLKDKHFRYDFITFLETCQNLEIDFLPITWQPALDTLGVGGQSEVRQSLVSLAMSFAFNRVKPEKGEEEREENEEEREENEEEREENEEEIYRALISQVCILRHPEIHNHPNIMHLIGVCWDIRTPVQENDHHLEATEPPWLKVWPVLVFEKTKHGDLNCFMRTDCGRNLGFTGRLKLCIDIASGIRDLHKNRVVHRDIKPHNVLISEDKDGSYTAKIADLGYSILLPGDSDYGYMPRSVPWEAPEQHDRGHLFSEIVKMDIYSFGLVCLWFLFNDKLAENDLIFDPLPDKRPHPLESKKQDGLKEIIERLVYETAQFSAREASGLVSFFRSCLAVDQENRASDISTLIEILDALSSTMKAIVSSESSAEVSTNNVLEPFQISRSVIAFYKADYRVRRYIASCLSKRLKDIRITNSLSQLQQASFQLAVCFRLGFGLDQSYEKGIEAVQQSGRSESDLNLEIEQISFTHYIIQNELFRNLNHEGLDTTQNTIHNTANYNLVNAQLELQKDLASINSISYNAFTLLTIIKNSLADIFTLRGLWQDAEELDVQVMETNLRVLGAEHPSTLSSIANLASTYRDQGRWKEAEELNVQVMETRRRVLGAEHPSTLRSVANLASTYRNQGRWKEAEELDVQVMQTNLRMLGAEHLSTLSSIANLTLTYWNQGRWKEAEELQMQVMETRKRVLGAEHPFTLSSVANLASTYRNQGRWKEAEKLDVQVMETRKRVLGAEHPDTLMSIANLASTYRDQGRWKEAEELEVQVMKTSLRVLGAKHPDTLIIIHNLALTYLMQGRWKKAEELQIQVMKTSKRILGAEHPSTLTIIHNLALTYLMQGRWKEADELNVQVVETRKRVLGAKHPDTLMSIANLTSTYRNQKRWKEAEELEVQVMETRKRVLGAEHPDTLMSIANLALTYRNQKRWKEAEELEVQVMETRKRVLGAEHPDTLKSIANLALTYWNQRRWKEAEKLEVQVMETRKRVLGAEHPDTLISIANLAVTYYSQWHISKAIRLMGDVVRCRIKRIGWWNKFRG